MKNEKIKLTAEEIVEFFNSKLTFDKTEKSVQYGWTSTHDGLYTITDIYKHFETKGIENKEVDDCIYKYFQKQKAFASKLEKMETGKTHNLFICFIYNHNPEYKSYFPHYFYDISMEEVIKLKKELQPRTKFLEKNLTQI